MALAEKLKARQETAGSPIMKDREKLETIDVLESMTLTLDAIDLMTKDGNEFAVVTFKEFPDGFYFGGKVLTDLVKMIYEESGIEEGKPLTVAEDNIELIAERKKSKSGRMYTAFSIK